MRGADGTIIAEKKVPSTNGVKGRDAQKAELLPIRKVELLPVWGTQGGTTADLSGEIGAPSFVPLPIFDRRLGARSTPALPAWGAQGGTTADLSGEIGASNFVPLPIFDGRLGARSTPALPAWGAQGGRTADPSGEIGAPSFVPLPIFDSRLGARSTPALPAWGAQDGKTVDNPGENGIILVGKDTEGAEDFNRLLKQSTCSSDDFYKYLNKINSDYADTYAKTGKWPSDVQIPKSPDALKADGTINWDEVPNGGYVLDGKGDAIKDQYVPGIGETIDRHGPNNGRFTSPVRNNKPYSYAQRSLPYMENPSQYHRYKVTGDLNNIEQYFIQSTDANLKQRISAYMKKFRLSFSDLETYRGRIASGFGEIGGGEQYELPLPVNMLEGLGLLKEF
ncbi:hypothetical protein KL86CLO1_11204 [uncultured Eubacteriales bacterium]|uniref:TNT domain-containing protein n=1 Tax=uncultured Eubacteriales bacterium TaxID=172733 RepID=A0A212JJ41_9FIRM|nr:hypothetical protein KL86CLO1_11204 [uncultured Eubacteriales bacterium]